MKKEIKIPEIAENVETGLIAGILVSKGDKVSTDQALVEVETDKATTDIPSPYEGTIDEIKVEEGDEVKVGQVIMIVETSDDDGKKEEKQETDTASKKEEKMDEKESETSEQAEKGKEKESQDRDKEEEKAEDKDEKKDEGKDKGQKQEVKKEKTSPSSIPAAPSVRRLARELGVDLSEVEGSGPGERISAGDVRNSAGKEKKPAEKVTPLPDFSGWGNTSRESMSNIRKLTADRLSEAWKTIPHVTQFDDADLTDLENFRKENQEKVKKEGGKLTVTAILLKISAFALQKFPRFNASIDMQTKEIVYKHYINIGVAVDTPKGLLVPVIKNVNEKSLSELSAELTEQAEKTRNGKISPDELQGGNFTISNLGGIGGTYFTPIVYPPQVAILGVSRSKFQQVYREDEFKKRLVIPLSLSYDHRLIDGVDGARFLRWICEVIEDPYAILF